MDNLFDINVNLIVIVVSISTVTITIASYAALRLMLEKPPARFHVQVPSEAKPDWKATKTVSNPSIRDPNDPTVIICYDPATGKYLSTVKAHTAIDVTEALLRARTAQKSWGKTSFAERKRVLNSLLNYVIEHQEEICWVTCRDSGKTMVDAMLGEILSTCERIRWTIKNGEKALATEFFEPGPLLPYKIAKVEYQPLGVVAALVSWNYPFHNLFGQIISALFAGNGILVKASEQVAWSVDYFSRIMKTCLKACGHDPEIVQFLCGYADCGEAIVRSGVDGITFVGSPQVGKQVMKAASDTLTPCILELGGKDAAILREDANLDQAIPIIMRGTFQNTGQNCVGIERVLVHEKLYDEFVRRVEEKMTTDELRVGCSLEEGAGKIDVGALTMSGQASRLENLIKDSVSQGAKLVVGGKSYIHPIYPSGQYFTPTLLVDVTPSMPISQHEVFAPIMTVMKFQTDEEAIEMCNGCPYGLGNSVFTQDQTKGNEMAKRLKSGMVNVNDFAVSYICNLPFGGVGISGFGRFGGREGLRALCLAKSVTMDRFPSLVKTTIPTVVDYPMHARGTTFVENLVRVVYKNDMLERIKGGLALVSHRNIPVKYTWQSLANTRTLLNTFPQMENDGNATSAGNTSTELNSRYANGYHRRSRVPTPLKHQDGPLESRKLANKDVKDFKRQQPSKNTRRSAQKIPGPKSPAPCPPLRVLQMAQAWDGTGPHPFPSGSSRERLFRAANDFTQGMVIARRIFTRIVNESGSVSLNVSTGGLAKITSALLCDKRSFYFGSWDDAKNLAKAIQGDTMMKGAIGMSVPVDEAIRIMKKMLIREGWNVVKVVFEATVMASITLGYLKVWHDCKRGQETLNGIALIRRALSLIKYGWLQLDPHEKNYRVRGNTFKPSFERSCRVLLVDAILCGYSNSLDNTLFPLTDALAEAEKILENCQNACNNEVLSEGFQMSTYYKAHLAAAYRTKAIVAYHKANEAKIDEEERIILFDVAIQNYALAAQYLPCDDLDKAMHLWVISESLFKRGGTTIIEIKRIVEEAIACEEAASSVFGDLGVYTPKLYTMRCFKNIITQGQSCNDDTILPSNWDEPNWLEDKDFGRFVIKALDEYKKDKEETTKRARLFAAIHI